MGQLLTRLFHFSFRVSLELAIMGVLITSLVIISFNSVDATEGVLLYPFAFQWLTVFVVSPVMLFV